MEREYIQLNNELEKKLEENSKFKDLFSAFEYLSQSYLFLMGFIEDCKDHESFYLLAYDFYLQGIRNFLDYFGLEIRPDLFIGVLLERIKRKGNLDKKIKEELNYMEEFIEIEDNVHKIVKETLSVKNPLNNRIKAETELGMYYEPLKNIAHMVFILYFILGMRKTDFIEQKGHRICLYCILASMEVILSELDISKSPMDFIENLLKKIGISPQELKI